MLFCHTIVCVCHIYCRIDNNATRWTLALNRIYEETRQTRRLVWSSTDRAHDRRPRWNAYSAAAAILRECRKPPSGHFGATGSLGEDSPARPRYVPLTSASSGSSYRRTQTPRTTPCVHNVTASCPRGRGTVRPPPCPHPHEVARRSPPKRGQRSPHRLLYATC